MKILPKKTKIHHENNYIWIFESFSIWNFYKKKKMVKGKNY